MNGVENVGAPAPAYAHTATPALMTPVPDPTTLTNELVSRAIISLREILETRLDANDKALDQLSRTTDARVSAAVVQVKELYAETFRRVEAHIESLANVSDQRFLRIDAGLTERDKRAEQLGQANDKALVAALAAQKEAAAEAGKSAALAISKSENATAEAIKQGQTLFQTGLVSLTNQVTDLKSRLDKGEGSRGVIDPTTEARLNALSSGMGVLMSGSDRRSGGEEVKKDSSTTIFAILGVIVAALAVGVAVLALIHH